MEWQPIEEFEWHPTRLLCWHRTGWDTFHVPRQYPEDPDSGPEQWRKMIEVYGITHYCIPKQPTKEQEK